MPSIWYHLMTPPVKACGCWMGTGSPFTFLCGCRRCLALSRTVSDRRFLMSSLESLIFSISSASSFFWPSASSYNKAFSILHVVSIIQKHTNFILFFFRFWSKCIFTFQHYRKKFKIKQNITDSSTFTFLACDIISWKTQTTWTTACSLENEGAKRQSKAMLYLFRHNIWYFIVFISPPLLSIWLNRTLSLKSISKMNGGIITVMPAFCASVSMSREIYLPFSLSAPLVFCV